MSLINHMEAVTRVNLNFYVLLHVINTILVYLENILINLRMSLR